MLPCTRRCLSGRLRRKAARLSQDQTALRASQAPLLFLHPRCFTHTVYRQQSAPRRKADSGSIFSIEGPSAESPSPPQHAALSDIPVRRLVWDREYGYIQDTVQQRIARLPRSTFRIDSWHDPKAVAPVAKTPTYGTTREPFRILRYESRLSMRGLRKRRARVRTTYFDRCQPWDELIDILYTLPLEVSLTEGKSLEVSDAFIGQHTASQRPNTWVQSSGSGSIVQVLAASSPPDGSRKLLLHGTERAVELAEEDLKKLQAEYGNLLDPSKDDQTNLPVDLDINSLVSMSTFTQYVMQVTNRYVQRGLARESGQSWNQSVADVLAKLFQHPDTSKYASVVALNHALSFLCRHDELRSTAQFLHSCARALHLGMETSTANMLLRSALKMHDVPEARSVLREMQRSGTPANSHTWSLFFTTSRAEIKVRLLRLMKSKGVVMGPGAVTAIRKAALEDMFPRNKLTPKDFQQFLQQLDQVFGPDWLVLDTYHHLLRICTLRSCGAGIVDILRQLPTQRGIVTNYQTRLYILALERRRGLTRQSLSSFIASLKTADPPKMRLAVPSLFMSAWNRCCYNLCRVLWAYAAVKGQITYKMQETVNKHLIRNGHTDVRSDTRKRVGARMIAGVQLWQPHEMENLKASFPKLAAHCDSIANAALWLTKYVPDDGTRDEQLSLAYLTMNGDLNAWKRFRPLSAEHFSAMLEQAYDKDEQWHKEGRLDVKGEDQMVRLIEQALRVELRVLQPGEVNRSAIKRVQTMRQLARALRDDQPTAAEEEEEESKPWWSV